MGGGCLSGLTRMVARACFQLGIVLASILIRTLAFLLLCILGPLGLGMTREVVRRLIGGAPGRSRDGSVRGPGNWVAYTLTAGTLWALCYALFQAIWLLLKWTFSSILSEPVTPVPGGSHFLLVATLLFIVGAIVGALAYHYDEQLHSHR